MQPPKFLLIAILFAVCIDRSFENPNVIITTNDEETLQIVSQLNVDRQYGILPILVTNKADDAKGKQILNFFDEKIRGITILQVNVAFKCNKMTTNYLYFTNDGSPPFPFVVALKYNKLLCFVVNGYDPGNLDILFRQAIGEMPYFFVWGYKTFTTDLRARIDQNIEKNEKHCQVYKSKKEAAGKTVRSRRPKGTSTPPSSAVSTPSTGNEKVLNLDLDLGSIYRDWPAAADSSTTREAGKRSSSTRSFDRDQSKKIRR